MNAIKNLVRSRTFWIASGLLTGYWPIAYLFSGPGFIELLNSVLFAVAVVVMISYAPEALRAAARDKPDETDQLIMGIALSWAGMIMFRGWGIYSRANDFPEWMRYHPMFGFMIFVLILGGVLHATAPNTINGRVPSRTWWRIGLAIGFGAFIAGMIVGYRLALPSLSNLLQGW